MNENVKDYYVAPSAEILGNVHLEKDASVWYQSVVRAEDDQIIIGKGCNIQDRCVLHVDQGFPIVIGDYVTVGHGAILHGCEIGDETLIGMGAIILNGAKIGKNCMIAAGALITQGMIVPDGSVMMGSPAKMKRKLTQEEEKKNKQIALDYINHARKQFQNT